MAEQVTDEAWIVRSSGGVGFVTRQYSQIGRHLGEWRVFAVIARRSDSAIRAREFSLKGDPRYGEANELVLAAAKAWLVTVAFQGSVEAPAELREVDVSEGRNIVEALLEIGVESADLVETIQAHHRDDELQTYAHDALSVLKMIQCVEIEPTVART